MKINISANIFTAIIIILFSYGAFASVVYSNDLKNWNVKQGVSERSVHLVREHANAPKFYEANSLKQKSIKIVTSITPLASIIAMLVKDQAEIVAIANNNDCPHHYHLRPSDLKKVEDADIVFYIDEQFDGFAGKLMNGHSKNVIKISNFNGLRVISNNSYDNWHIWLDLENVKLLLEQLFQVLSQRFPEISSAIYQNLKQAEKQIEELTKIKHQRLASLTDVILLSNSLEYFFNNSQKNVARLYSSDQKSMRYISNLEHLLSMSNSKCLLLSTEQDVALYKNFKVEVVEVESENWQTTNINSDLFYNQYLKIINQVSKCLNY